MHEDRSQLLSQVLIDESEGSTEVNQIQQDFCEDEPKKRKNNNREHTDDVCIARYFVDSNLK